MDNNELCINLSKAETEKEVVDLLNQGGHSTSHTPSSNY